MTISDNESKTALPAAGETIASVWPRSFKRTALLFDRIHRFPLRRTDLTEIWWELPDEIAFGAPDVFDDLIHGFVEDVCPLIGAPKPPQETSQNSWLQTRIDRLLHRSVVRAYAARSVEIIPIYDSEGAFAREFPFGVNLGYQAAVECIPSVTEDALTWEQVLEFRRDDEARRKYRALRGWLQDGISATSVSSAKDRIEQKIEDYRWAIRKHGFETAIGTISHILSTPQLAVIAAGSGVVGLTTGPIAAALAGGLIIGSQVAVWVAERRLELEEVKRGAGSEVALLYDARRLVTGVG